MHHDLITIFLVWINLSSHCLTVPSICIGQGINHVLNTSLSTVVRMSFWVFARLDIALGNLKAYQRLLGIVSVMNRINIYCNRNYYFYHLPILTMLQMLITLHREKCFCVARYLGMRYSKIAITRIPERLCWFVIREIHMGWHHLGMTSLIMWSEIFQLKTWPNWIGW